MNMKKSISILMAVFIVSLSVSAQTWQPADPDATPEAKQLFTRLLNIQSKGIMYGHQDDLMTGHTWWYEPGRSDTKEAVGDYPAVAGFELGEIEFLIRWHLPIWLKEYAGSMGKMVSSLSVGIV